MRARAERQQTRAFGSEWRYFAVPFGDFSEPGAGAERFAVAASLAVWRPAAK